MSRTLIESNVDWIGKIPNTWNIQPLGLFLKERKEKVSDNEYAPLSVTKNGIVPQLDSAAKSDAHDDRKKVCKNDFVINSRSDRKQSCGLSDYDGSVSLINIVLQIYKYYPNFIKYALDNCMFAEEYYRNGHGIVSDLWTTKYTEMKKIYLPEPPLKEQIKIANYLQKKCSMIDDIVNDNNKEIKLLEEYRNNLITKTVKRGTGFINNYKNTNVDWIGNIPVSWDIFKLRFLGNLRSGLSNKKPEDFGHGYPFLTYKDVYKNYSFDSTNLSELVNSNENDWTTADVKRGDVFFTGSSETIDELGLSSVCTKDVSFCTFNGFCIRFRPNNKIYMNPEYYKYYFRSGIVREFLIRNDNSVTRTNLSQNTLKNVLVLVPPKDEQDRIAKYLDKQVMNLDQIIEYRKQIIEKLEEYKRSLIYECVTGKREV